MKLYDFHCDTMSRMWEAEQRGEMVILGKNHLALDVEKLKKGNYKFQCFASFINQERKEIPRVQAEKQLEILKREIKNNSKDLCLLTKKEDLLDDRIQILASIEGGEACEGNIELLHKFFEEGVRLMTLTWNFENELGYSHREQDKGLKRTGIEFIQEMEQLGMAIDVSHLSDAGFYDVYKYTKAPFLASHSNAREIYPASRNLTDDMIRKIGERGGIIGLNYYSKFLGENALNLESYLEQLVNHIEHIYMIGGKEVVALGSDFDGMEAYAGFQQADHVELLIQLLKKNKNTRGIVNAIAEENGKRFIKEMKSFR